MYRDHSVADRLQPLQAALARTEGVTNRARDHRGHRGALPTLPHQAIPTGVSDEIRLHAAFGVHQMTAPANGWTKVGFSHGWTINTRSAHHAPRCPPAPTASIAAGISPQAGQLRHIAARPQPER